MQHPPSHPILHLHASHQLIPPQFDSFSVILTNRPCVARSNQFERVEYVVSYSRFFRFNLYPLTQRFGEKVFSLVTLKQWSYLSSIHTLYYLPVTRNGDAVALL
ncbi:hypothetical protein FRC03_005101 [Tulasnella sp. 419]|nr:hypothetical protein FRC03_005101 [Tulasnella sp. 419]